MAIKRLTRAELEERCTEIFYDYMLNGKQFYSEGSALTLGSAKKIPQNETPVDMLYKETKETIEESNERIKFLQEAMDHYKDNKALYNIHKEQQDVLIAERELFLNSNMKTQKEYFKKTGIVEYSRNMVKIPLDKLINSYYDDLFLQVLFYDDLGVIKGKYDQYKAITNKEERAEFIKANTEITHMGLMITGSTDHVKALIALKGELKSEEELKSVGDMTCLSTEYADFTTLSLAKTMEVLNNDVRQVLQSKIDLDKESLELLAEKEVRGDLYKVYRAPEMGSTHGSYEKISNSFANNELFIRYVCPSTGRIYYNVLNEESLGYSDYFHKGDYESYINAWWSLNNLGASVEGEAIIRC